MRVSCPKHLHLDVTFVPLFGIDHPGYGTLVTNDGNLIPRERRPRQAACPTATADAHTQRLPCDQPTGNPNLMPECLNPDSGKTLVAHQQSARLD